MPKKSSKALASAFNGSKRCKNNEEDIIENLARISDDDGCNEGCQTDFTNSKRFRSIDTQTHTKISSTICKFDFGNVSDLIDILIDSCTGWNSINNRILSVILNLTTR